MNAFFDSDWSHFTEVLDRMVQIKNNNDNDICFEIEKKGPLQTMLKSNRKSDIWPHRNRASNSEFSP